MPRATPNMTNARMILTIMMPCSPKLMVMELRDSSCSFILLQVFHGAKITKNGENEPFLLTFYFIAMQRTKKYGAFENMWERYSPTKIILLLL